MKLVQSKDNVSQAIYLDFNSASFFLFFFFFLIVAAAQPNRCSSGSEERARTCYRQRDDA